MLLPAARTDELDDRNIADERTDPHGIYGSEIVRLAVALQPDLPASVDKPGLLLFDEVNLISHSSPPMLPCYPMCRL